MAQTMRAADKASSLGAQQGLVNPQNKEVRLSPAPSAGI